MVSVGRRSLRWSPVLCVGLRSLQLSSWSPSVSGGLRWSPVVFGGLRWFPVVSDGLRGSP